jgi:hypothetical protein
MDLEEVTFDDLRVMSKDELDKIPYQRKKWLCQCKGCTNGTHVRDYGVSPFFWLDRNSNWAQHSPEELWTDLTKFCWMCSKHRKLISRLRPRFSDEHIRVRLYDLTSPIDRLIDTKTEFQYGTSSGFSREERSYRKASNNDR